MKKILTISLTLLILLQSFSKVWIILSFKINQAYIAQVLCVNRMKPELLCSGKCVLTTNLKADEEQDGKQRPSQLKEQKETTYCFDFLPLPIDKPEEIDAYPPAPSLYCGLRSSSRVTRIFHPPDAQAVAGRCA